MKKKYITPEIEVFQMNVESALMSASINGITPGTGDGSDMNSNSRDTDWDEEI